MEGAQKIWKCPNTPLIRCCSGYKGFSSFSGSSHVLLTVTIISTDGISAEWLCRVVRYYAPQKWRNLKSPAKFTPVELNHNGIFQRRSLSLSVEANANLKPMTPSTQVKYKPWTRNVTLQTNSLKNKIPNGIPFITFWQAVDSICYIEEVSTIITLLLALCADC